MSSRALYILAGLEVAPQGQLCFRRAVIGPVLLGELSERLVNIKIL